MLVTVKLQCILMDLSDSSSSGKMCRCEEGVEEDVVTTFKHNFAGGAFKCIYRLEKQKQTVKVNILLDYYNISANALSCCTSFSMV